MQLQELKDQIVLRLGHMYSVQFYHDIDKCNNGYELLHTLEEYGYDKQGSLDIMFSILID